MKGALRATLSVMDEPDLTRIVEELVRGYEVLDVALLIPIFSAFRGLDDQGLRDKEEERNLRVLQGLLPENELGFRGVLYKPAEFIHPFGEHYSLPGYLDVKVLPHFIRATNELAKDCSGSSGSDLLAFVYMYFLLIHPLPDGNGRTARWLLDYYNKKLRLDLEGTWKVKEPVKFSEEPLHKEAFRIFFSEEAVLRPRKEFCDDDPYPIPAKLKPQLERMAEYMIGWAQSVGSRKETLGERHHVQCMSNLIR
jgi:hypothetical protein